MSKIKTVKDLEAEQLRLAMILKSHEASIKDDWVGVRTGIRPLNKVYKVMSKMATRDNTAPVLNFGLEFGIDLFVRKFLLAKAGWFTKIVIPFLVKNYSSHIIGAEKRAELLKKVRTAFKSIRPVKTSDKQATYASAATSTTPKPSATL